MCYAALSKDGVQINTSIDPFKSNQTEKCRKKVFWCAQNYSLSN